MYYLGWRKWNIKKHMIKYVSQKKHCANFIYQFRFCNLSEKIKSRYNMCLILFLGYFKLKSNNGDIYDTELFTYIHKYSGMEMLIKTALWS